MTTMNFTLSATLGSTLTAGGAGNGVYAYAFAFSGADYVGQTTLVSNGVVENLSLALPSSFPSGTVYVVVQEGGDGSLPATLISGGNPLGNINPINAQEHNYSYQLFEATLSNSKYDQGDISALNTFGLPSTYAVTVDGAPVTLGFAPGQTGAGIYSVLGSTQSFSPNSFPSADRLAIGPATADNHAPFPSQDWANYVNNLKTNTAVLNDITMVVPFSGGTPLQAAPMLSEYGVKYVAADSFGTDYFWLVPDTGHGATNTDWIRIPAAQLMQNIYVQPGPLEVHTATAGGTPSPTATFYTSFTPNNADGAVAKYFVSGFDAGYWGGSGTSANPLDPTVVDLNKTWNWNVNYAYDATLTSTAITYTNVLGSGPGTTGGNDRFYDPWAQEIQKVSNAYGYSYTDLVSSGGVNPQITLWDPSANGGAGGNVSSIDITLYANSETLPSSSGFQAAPPVYVAPAHANYTAANTPTHGNINELGFAFQYGLGAPPQTFAPSGQTPALFKFYAPGDASAGSDGFVSLTVPVLSGTGAAGAPESSIWNILTVQGGPGHWSLASNAGANPYSQQDGQFSIYNVPVTADGTAGWYQLVFGGSGAQTVYNIYATNVGGVFQPITGTGGDVHNFVIDHGVAITEAPSPAGYYTLNFAPGGAMTYSIDTFSASGAHSGTGGDNAPPDTGGSGGSGLVIADGKVGFDSHLGTVTLVAAGGVNHDGAFHGDTSFSLTDVTAHFQAGQAAAFALQVDAGSGVGDAPQVSISYDFTGDGTVDRVETWHYFATNDTAGWESYGSHIGLQSATGAAMQDLVGGTVTVALWTALGSHPVQVDLAHSTLTLPFGAQSAGGGSAPDPVPTPDPAPAPNPSPPPVAGGGLVLSDGAVHFDPAQGIVTLASSNGANHDGAPHDTASFTLENITAGYLAGDTTGFKLMVDAGAHVGDAAQMAISYDFDGNGTFDRTETYRYFATDDGTGWQAYDSGAGPSAVSGAAMQNLVGGAVKVDLWTAIGSHQVSVDLASSSLDLPFSFGQGSGGPAPQPPVQPQPQPTVPTDSTHFLVSAGSSALQLSTPGDVVIASAAGGHYIDQPHDAVVFKAEGLNGHYDGGGTSFTLPVDAGSGVGNGTQLRLSFDFDGNGTTDRTETWQYFETNNVAGWENYTQARGLNSASGAYADFTGGSVTAEVWNTIGTSPVTLHEGASVILPYHGWLT
ncbi:MAG: hypothetical protein ISP45_03575 [Reyranella sp.]|nr:hypothetical protein [Reyranella sp.]